MISILPLSVICLLDIGTISTICFFFIILIQQFRLHLYCFIVCEDKVADIIFVADLSSSIGYDAFDQLTAFIKDVVGRFTIGPGNIQIGLVTYSTVAKTEFNLNKYR